MPTPDINGRVYWRALSYATRACPTSDASQRLQHLVFHGPRIISSDGERWHLGMLPAEAALAPVAVSRSSVTELILTLQYAYKMAKRRCGDFFVRQDGPRVEVHYGNTVPLIHELQQVHMGGLPDIWEEPVRADAPILDGPPRVSCEAMRDAVSWYRAWDHDHGDLTWRGQGPDRPVRLDLHVEQEHVASAILLPMGRPAAQLPLDEPLFNGGRAVGQSILHLEIDTPAAPPEVLATVEAKARREARAAKKKAKAPAEVAS